jgi:MoxR-like ATPase
VGDLAKNVKGLAGVPGKILEEVSKVVVGKDEIKEMLLVALLSEGHVLIEGLPGTAKTLLAKTFSQVIGGEFKRIQFTPDMLPADVTGFYLYTPDGNSRFMEGPLFANVVLSDELNRTTPRTQSALIEAMQERQVTVEGKTRLLPRPFMIIASQLPYGSEGTYPLTEVQADRFMLRVWSDYLSKEEEEQVISNLDYI